MLRIPLLTLLAALLLVVGLIAHQQVTDVANLALGYCWRPTSDRLAAGVTVPFDSRYFAGGGEAISPFYRLDVDGRYWYPAPGQTRWPRVGHADTLTLTSTNQLVVRDTDGTLTQYLPDSSWTTCSFTLTSGPRGSTLAWVVEVLAAAAVMIAAWLLFKPTRS
jgi:hypothetical protein